MQPEAVCSAACPIHRRRVDIELRAARALCEFRPAPATFTATISVGLMSIVAGGIVGGPLGDRFGRRTVLLASLPVFAVVGTLATALVTTQETMFVLRLIVCPGIGGLLPNLMALTTEYAPARLRIAVTTFVVGTLGIGGVAGGMFAASIIPAFGWHSIFIGRLGGRIGRPAVVCGVSSASGPYFILRCRRLLARSTNCTHWQAASASASWVAKRLFQNLRLRPTPPPYVPLRQVRRGAKSAWPRFSTRTSAMDCWLSVSARWRSSAMPRSPAGSRRCWYSPLQRYDGAARSVKTSRERTSNSNEAALTRGDPPQIRAAAKHRR